RKLGPEGEGLDPMGCLRQCMSESQIVPCVPLHRARYIDQHQHLSLDPCAIGARQTDDVSVIAHDHSQRAAQIDGSALRRCETETAAPWEEAARSPLQVMKCRDFVLFAKTADRQQLSRRCCF